MTVWRALTLQQPWAWAVSYAGKDIENRTWPVPAKYFGRECGRCNGAGWELPSFASNTPIWCKRCRGAKVESFRVMIHAGASWDKMHGKSIGLPDDHNPTHRAFLDYYPDGQVDMVAGYPEGVNCPLGALQPFGAVVAVATITGQHKAHYVPDGDPRSDHWCEGYSLTCWSDWGSHSGDPEKPMWHWELGDVTVLDEPVPAKGRQRLWIPDADIVDAVEAQL